MADVPRPLIRRIIDRLTEAAREQGEHQQAVAGQGEHVAEAQLARELARGRALGLREALLLALDADDTPPF